MPKASSEVSANLEPGEFSWDAQLIDNEAGAGMFDDPDEEKEPGDE